MRLSCPVCGPAEARLWRRAGPWRILRCTECGLGITWPPSDQEDPYDEAYYDGLGMGASAAAAWGERAEALLQSLPQAPGRVLDWGAGLGHLVAALRERGVEAEGFEPSTAGRRAAQRLHGLSLRPDPPPGPFDVVMMIHSLEHVQDPVVGLREVAQATRPGGVVLVEVPHAASIEIWRPRMRRQILCLPAHRFHFTPGSLAAALRRAGLQPEPAILTNPAALEWLFAWRRRRRSVAGRQHEGAAGTAGAGSAPPTGLRALWRRRLLPQLREWAPGWRFQILARVPDGRVG